MNSDNGIGLPYLHDFFYTEIPSNKDELLNGIENGELDDDQEFEWAEHCAVKFERLKIKDNLKLFIPSINNYLEQLQIEGNSINIQLRGLWRNVYHKHCFQETHDHLHLHLSGVVFITDYQKNDSKFYIQHRHHSEISKEWRELCLGQSRYYVEGKRGQVLLFPSYMMHGVTVHKSNSIRKTVAFNLLFN